jgi:hypothetical protein
MREDRNDQIKMLYQIFALPSLRANICSTSSINSSTVLSKNPSVEVFLENRLRRELSDNFCYFNPSMIRSMDSMFGQKNSISMKR